MFSYFYIERKFMELYLIRHGQPDYSWINSNDNIMTSSYAPLTEKGVQQAIELRKKININDKIIISSPFTRALETARYLANGKEIIIENNLHEWLPSKSYNYVINDFSVINNAYKNNNGEFCDDYDYETKQELYDRMQKMIDKYKDNKKVIFVCHARLIAAYLNCKEPKYCEIKHIKVPV